MHEAAEHSITERGVVTSVSETYIQVLCQSKQNCKRCEEGKGCGGGILARWLGERQHQLQIPYSRKKFNPRVDQIAEFSLPASLIVKLAAVTYGLPLLILALVFFALASMQISELLIILLGITVFVIGFIFARKLIEIMIRHGHLVPKLRSLHTRSSEVSCAIENIDIRS